MKDPVKLSAIVDLNSPQFGLEIGCQVKPAKMFCVPATKTVIEAEDRATGQLITLLDVSGPFPDDRSTPCGALGLRPSIRRAPS